MQDRFEKVGLCATCGYMRRVGSRRGSVFFLCERASFDPGYARYPKLPVLRCGGFAPATTQQGGAAGSGSDD